MEKESEGLRLGVILKGYFQVYDSICVLSDPFLMMQIVLAVERVSVSLRNN
jgi:hypothetical protein